MSAMESQEPLTGLNTSKSEQGSETDPLLECLIALTKLHNQPCSKAALTSGLPLVNNKLTPNLFVRAAERGKLTAEILSLPLNKISKKHLPAVVLFNGHTPRVLTELDEKGNGVFIKRGGTDTETVPLKRLQAVYSGKIIVATPVFTFTERSDEIALPRSADWFWKVLKDALPTYSEVLVASLLINIFALALPLFIMNVYDRVVPNQAFATLWVLAIGVFFVLAFDFVMKLLRNYYIDKTGHKIDAVLSSSIFEHMLGLKMASRPASVGVMANTVNAFEAFREFITSATISVLVDLPFLFLFIAVIWSIGGPLAFIPIIMIPLVVLVGLLVQVPLNDLIKQGHRYGAEKNAALLESLSGVETIKTMCGESPVQRKWEQIVCFSTHVGQKVRSLSSFVINFSTFSQQLASVLVVIGGVYLVSSGDLSVGGLIACTILTGRCLAPMSQIAGLLTRWHQSRSALHSIDQIMKAPVERGKHQNLLHRPILSGSVEFKNVSFKYPGESNFALDNVSFRIEPGERVAIIGRVGSGKSTIEKLILGLYPVTSGHLLIDNTEIEQIDPADLRHNIGYVPQDIVLFYGSIKENITLGAPFADDAQVLKAVDISGVGDFIKHNAQGFDLQVGEQGSRLSGGQRQGIAIARALLRDPNVLVMDEPSNAMDDYTENQFKTALQENMGGKTLIISTHKGSMLSLVDRIIIIDGGKVVSDGPRDQVLKALESGNIRASR